MRQFHDIEIIMIKEVLEKGYVELETAQGYTLKLRVVDNLPEKTNGVRVYATHSVLLTASDIEEMQKPDSKKVIRNQYAGQTQFVKFIEMKKKRT